MKSILYGAVGLVAGIAISATALTTGAFSSTPDAEQPMATAMADMDMDMSETMASAEGADMANMDMSDMGAMHDHPLREVAADTVAPTITHLVFPDAMDGYNVQILADNFTFTPASINREVVEGEGHAHVYVNGVKIARVYGNWYHLPSALFEPGVNIVSVSLNANDHSEWAVEGEPIASTVRVIRPEAS